MWNKIKKIYIGNNLVRPAWWKPWSNTLLYLPFNWNYNDESWKWTTLTLASGSIAYSTTTQWEQYANISSWVILSWLTSNFDINNWTNSQWVYLTSTWVVVWWYAWWPNQTSVPWSENNWYWTGIIFDSNAKILLFKWNWDIQTNVQITRNAWHNIIITQWSWTTKIYIDWTQQYSSSVTYSKRAEKIWLFANPYWTYPNKFTWRYDEFILEQWVWDLAQAKQYYNQTKSNYWL